MSQSKISAPTESKDLKRQRISNNQSDGTQDANKIDLSETSNTGKEELQESLQDEIDIEDCTDDKAPIIATIFADERTASGRKKFTCKDCGTSMVHLARHKTICPAQKMHCNRCSVVVNVDAYHKHASKSCEGKSNRGIIQCPYCVATFDSAENFGYHSAKAHNRQYSTNIVFLEASELKEWRDTIEHYNNVRYREYGTNRFRCIEAHVRKHETQNGTIRHHIACGAFIRAHEMPNKRLRILYSTDHCHQPNLSKMRVTAVTLERISRLLERGYTSNRIWEELRLSDISTPHEQSLSLNRINIAIKSINNAVNGPQLPKIKAMKSPVVLMKRTYSSPSEDEGENSESENRRYSEFNVEDVKVTKEMYECSMNRKRNLLKYQNSLLININKQIYRLTKFQNSSCVNQEACDELAKINRLFEKINRRYSNQMILDIHAD